MPLALMFEDKNTFNKINPLISSDKTMKSSIFSDIAKKKLTDLAVKNIKEKPNFKSPDSSTTTRISNIFQNEDLQTKPSYEISKMDVESNSYVTNNS